MTSKTLAGISERVRSHGGRLVAITPECQPFVRQQKAEAGADFEMLCDAGKGYAASLNLLIWLGAEVQALLSGLGRDLGTYQGDPSWFVPIPATFVVAQSGIISARHTDPDYRRRMDTDDLLLARSISARRSEPSLRPLFCALATRPGRSAIEQRARSAAWSASALPV